MLTGMPALLLSTSTLYGQSLLSYALPEIDNWLSKSRELVFVPYALKDHGAYTRRVSAALQPLGVRVLGAHETDDVAGLIRDVGFVFVGGGNTFRLLDRLQASGLAESISMLYAQGLCNYMGSSAGTNVACPTIRTTNDMPIVQPVSFKAIGIVPFQINPHYLDPIEGLTHMGETRQTRLVEYLEENAVPVIGLREGSWIWSQNPEEFELRGGSARVFRRGTDPENIAGPARLSADLRPLSL